MITAINSAQPGLLSQIQKSQQFIQYNQSIPQSSEKNKSEVSFTGPMLKWGGLGAGVLGTIAGIYKAFEALLAQNSIGMVQYLIGTVSFIIGGALLYRKGGDVKLLGK